MDGFAALETDRDEGDGDGGGDALFWADFDFPLYARLRETHELASYSADSSPTSPHIGALSRVARKGGLTRVAEIPGYPTKKLLFGGPRTRTNAAMSGEGGVRSRRHPLASPLGVGIRADHHTTCAVSRLLALFRQQSGLELLPLGQRPGVGGLGNRGVNAHNCWFMAPRLSEWEVLVW